MLILLPPSEGKTTPRRGKPLDLGGLSFPELEPHRAEVLDAFVKRARVLLGPRMQSRAASK